MLRKFATLCVALFLATAAALLSAAPGRAATEPEIEEMSLGSADAPVTVVEYASFTCPHCRNFHDTVFDRLKSEYIDTGKIRFIYREVYFDRYGLWAGLLARCGGAERYFGLVDLIYDKQSEWLEGDEPVKVADNLRRLGRTAGLSSEQVDACMQDGDKAQALVSLYQENVKADGIRSTPSFIIDGELQSNMSFEEFSTILDEKLGE